jgi:protein-tyrosine phosphatase
MQRLLLSEGVDPATVERAVQLLRQGEVVALPTETVYGLAALPIAESKLRSLKQRDADKPLTLAVHSREAAEALADLSHRGLRRLARRFWPGPLTLVARARSGDGTLGLRVPAHKTTLAILQALDCAVLLTSANPGGQPPARTADEVQAFFGDGVELLLDGGETTIGEASTIVRFDGPRAEVLRSGLIDPEMVYRTAATRILVVCSGNTCRSPMGELLLRAEWSRLYGVEPEALLPMGGQVESAGTAAIPGLRASPEAIEVLAGQGLDLNLHRSSQVTPDRIQSADRIFVMTRAHRSALQQMDAGPADKAELLDPSGKDVDDPIGGTTATYRRCAQRIQGAARERAKLLYEETPRETP